MVERHSVYLLYCDSTKQKGKEFECNNDFTTLPLPDSKSTAIVEEWKLILTAKDKWILHFSSFKSCSPYAIRALKHQSIEPPASRPLGLVRGLVLKHY